MNDSGPRNAMAPRGDADRYASSVLAKGYGDLATQVIAAARSHGIHVHESPELVALLMRLDLDERIPPRLYDVVAEILAWLGELDDAERAPGGGAPFG